MKNFLKMIIIAAIVLAFFLIYFVCEEDKPPFTDETVEDVSGLWDDPEPAEPIELEMSDPLDDVPPPVDRKKREPAHDPDTRKEKAIVSPETPVKKKKPEPAVEDEPAEDLALRDEKTVEPVTPEEDEPVDAEEPAEDFALRDEETAEPVTPEEDEPVDTEEPAEDLALRDEETAEPVTPEDDEPVDAEEPAEDLALHDEETAEPEIPEIEEKPDEELALKDDEVSEPEYEDEEKVYPSPEAMLDPGESITYTIGDADFSMTAVPALDFPAGTRDSEIIDSVNEAFMIGQTEVTYKFWKAVYDWGTSPERGDKRYYFDNPGRMGSAPDGENMTSSHPVTMVSWRDAIVWTNALTEYFNEVRGTDLVPVYYADSDYKKPLRDSRDPDYINSVNTSPGSPDRPYIKAEEKGNTVMKNSIAGGFRLPASDEWELAARYRGSETSNTSDNSPVAGVYWTKGDSASGAVDSFENRSASSRVAVFGRENSSPVKSRADGANKLGLYDMSGNVWEWCFEWHPDYVEAKRVGRGGSFAGGSANLRIGVEGNGSPYFAGYSIGFRIAKTQSVQN